jgi:hypothetical protein
MFGYDFDVDGSVVRNPKKDVKPMAKRRRDRGRDRKDMRGKDLVHEESKKGPVRSMEERKKERASGSKADCHLSVPTAQVC